MFLRRETICLLFIFFTTVFGYSQGEDSTVKIKVKLGEYTLSWFSLFDDGKKAYIGDWDKKFKLWDVVNAKELKSYDILFGDVRICKFSSDGSKALYETWDKVLHIYDMETGKDIKTLKLNEYLSNDFCAISPDCKYVVLNLIDDKTIKLWDASSSIASVRTLKGHTDEISYVGFSSDSKYAISADFDQNLILWDVKTGFKSKAFVQSYGTWGIDAVITSSDSKYILCGGYYPYVLVYDLSTTKEVLRFSGHENSIQSIAYSKDGKYIASGSYDYTIKYWDSSNGKLIRTLKGHTGPVNSLNFSSDGNYLTSSSGDSTLKYWNIKTGELIYSVTLREGEILVWTPEGFFTGSEKLAREVVYIEEGTKTIGIDQFYDILYRPDLVEAKISGKDISVLAEGKSLDKLIHKDGLPPIVEFVTQSRMTDIRDITIKMKVRNTGGGIGKITVFVEGEPVTVSEGERGLKQLQKGTDITEYEYESLITLRYGMNNIEFSAYNKNNTIESKRASVQLIYKESSIIKPDLYILTVAINMYRDNALRLKYSINDADSISDILKKKSGNLYGKVNIYKLYDDEVTLDGFSKKFDDLSKVIKPDDVFIFYLAGHGVTNEQDGDYYFLPVNFRYTGSEAINSGGISKNIILNNLTKIKAQKTILFFDTCNSGSFIDNPTKRGISEKTAIDRLKKAIGRAIIVASSENQAALEGIENHGVFTYSLLKALTGGITNKKDYISISDLSAFIENDVPEITYKKWKYEQIPQKELPKTDFPIVTK